MSLYRSLWEFSERQTSSFEATLIIIGAFFSSARFDKRQLKFKNYRARDSPLQTTIVPASTVHRNILVKGLIEDAIVVIVPELFPREITSTVRKIKNKELLMIKQRMTSRRLKQSLKFAKGANVLGSSEEGFWNCWIFDYADNARQISDSWHKCSQWRDSKN